MYEAPVSDALHVGDRVSTPDGPGRVVSFWQVFEWPHRRMDVVVELDEGQEWRKIYQPAELRLVYSEAKA
jgi:hypothetical protein